MSFFNKIKSIATFQSGGAAPVQSRNELMVEDVRKFAQEIKAFHKEYLGLSAETQRRLAVVSAMLDRPLPRVFQNGSTGAQPAEETRRIGLTVPTAGIDKARAELDQRLHSEVMANIESWITDYREIKASHRENLRLLGMVNDQRKTATAMNEKYQKLARKDLNIHEMEIAKAKAKQEEEKYNEYQQRYIQREQEVYNQLVQLIKRSALFKDGIAMSLRIFHGAFAAGYQVFEDAHNAVGLMAPVSPQAASNGGFGTPGYLVVEPDDFKRASARSGAPPALPSPADYGHANGSNGGAPEYAPRPADPYAPPTQYGAAATGYGMPASDASSFGRTSSPSHSSGSAATPSSQSSVYPTKGEATLPSAQEKGSTAWVESAAPAPTPAVTQA